MRRQECGRWDALIGAQWISHNLWLQFSSSWPCSLFSICCYLQCGQKVSTHKCHDFTLPPCLCSLFLPVDRGRGREDAGKKSSWIKHLSSRGIFVSSCQNPNVLWRDYSIFQRGLDRGSQQAFYVCCQKHFYYHSLTSAPLSFFLRCMFFFPQIQLRDQKCLYLHQGTSCIQWHNVGYTTTFLYNRIYFT